MNICYYIKIQIYKIRINIFYIFTYYFIYYVKFDRKIIVKDRKNLSRKCMRINPHLNSVSRNEL